MIRRITAAVAFLLIVTCAFPQVTPPADVARKSEEITAKIGKLDMLNFLLPLGMSKQQYSKLLPVIEKIRQTVRKAQELEAAELRKVEAEVDAALKDATEKGLVPKKELRDKLGSLFNRFRKAREITIDLNVDEMYEALKGIWNAGQMKTAAQSLNPKDYDPNAKVEEMKDEEKIKIFIREIMLHPQAYEVLVFLSQKKES